MLASEWRQPSTITSLCLLILNKCSRPHSASDYNKFNCWRSPSPLEDIHTLVEDIYIPVDGINTRIISIHLLKISIPSRRYPYTRWRYLYTRWRYPYPCWRYRYPYYIHTPAEDLFPVRLGYCWALTFRAHIRVSLLHVSRSLNKMENSLCSWPAWTQSRES